VITRIYQDQEEGKCATAAHRPMCSRQRVRLGLAAETARCGVLVALCTNCFPGTFKEAGSVNVALLVLRR
jgi:hypothetical protein